MNENSQLIDSNKIEWEKIAEMTMNQLEVACELRGKAFDQLDKLNEKAFDKLYSKATDQYEKYEALLSKFNLSHLEDNELEELFGFIPYDDDPFPQIEIIMKESKIFLTYFVYKSEEDYKKNISQKITFPLSFVEKYLKK